MIALLLLQVAAAAAPPQKIDLLATQRERCAADGNDIVVCGRKVDQRLKPIAPPAPSGPPDGPLSFRLPGGGTGKFHAIQTTLPGATGQGAAVTLKIPFGKRARKPAE